MLQSVALVVALGLSIGADDGVASEVSAEKTRFFWEAGRKAKEDFAKGFQGLALPSVQASKVTELANQTARELRLLDRNGVDPDVIDHMNNTIRHYENMAMSARRDGIRQIARTAIKAFLQANDEVGKAPPPPATADITAGVLKLLTNDEVTKSWNKLQDQEQALIKTMRKRYKIELAPW